MKDNEIIKALECCRKKECSTCPCYDDEIECGEMLIGHTIDLINRQKAEIDILIRKKENLRDELCELQAENERLTEALDGEAVENMRLKHEIEILRTNNNSMCKSMPNIAKAERAEAIKEFAEELKTRIKNAVFCCYDLRFKGHLQELLKIIVAKIDNLVKEMTEE